MNMSMVCVHGAELCVVLRPILYMYQSLSASVCVLTGVYTHLHFDFHFHIPYCGIAPLPFPAQPSGGPRLELVSGAGAWL